MSAWKSTVITKSEAELEKMRAAGQLAARALAYALSLVKPGVTTGYIDTKCDAWIRKHNAIPAPYKYQPDGRTPFPKSICTSVNEVICHGIPGKQELKDGDIVCIDITVILDGYHGDNASTVPVGEVSEEARKLMQTTLASLRRGIEAAREGGRLLDVGTAIQDHAEPLGYGVVEEFVGHGLGRKFHEPPQVSHVGRSHRGRGRFDNPKLRKGMTFTIEPMVNVGTWEQITLDDGWTAITKDRMLSAQYEHSIAIRGGGEPAEILTLLPDSDSNAPGGYEP